MEWAALPITSASLELRATLSAHSMALASLGMNSYIYSGMVGHALGTNVKFEPGDFNFFRERRDAGTKAAFQGRDSHHTNQDGPDDGAAGPDDGGAAAR